LIPVKDKDIGMGTRLAALFQSEERQNETGAMLCIQTMPQADGDIYAKLHCH